MTIGLNHHMLERIAVELYVAVLQGGWENTDIKKLILEIGNHTLICDKCSALKEVLIKRRK